MRIFSVYSSLLVLFYLYRFYALTPSRLPNGRLRTYTSSIPPSKDLYVVNYTQASLISKNWLQNIVVSTVEKERKKLENKVKNKSKKNDLSSGLFEVEDAHIVTSINQLEGYIQAHRSIKDIYMCWKPKSREGFQSVLFIIVAEIDKENKKFSIKQLVPSPFWSPEQIESNELKKALIEMNEINNCTKLDMNYLYQHDLRYRLAWATWHLDLDNKNHSYGFIKKEDIIDINIDDTSPSDTENNV